MSYVDRWTCATSGSSMVRAMPATPACAIPTSDSRSSRPHGTGRIWKASWLDTGILRLTFFSGAHESKGWQAALDRYKKNYQGAGHEMGKLEFANLRIEMLGPDRPLCRGEFHLTMSDGKTPHGLFTLSFASFPRAGRLCTITRRESERSRFQSFKVSEFQSPSTHCVVALKP